MTSNFIIHSAIAKGDLLRKTVIGINGVQKRTVWEKYSQGPMKRSNPQADSESILKSFFSYKLIEWLKFEKDLFIKSLKDSFTVDDNVKPNKLVMFEDFKSDESFVKWKTAVDSDSNNGYSRATFGRSRNGHGLFTGVLDTRLPDDALLDSTGFCALVSPKRPQHSFNNLYTYYDWTPYNCVELKIRGDGRTYSFVLDCSSYFGDSFWYRNFSHPLFTRGGPYWQVVRIPFKKLIYNRKGFIQDKQIYPMIDEVKTMSITLSDDVPGPFSLEIDYIALVNDESITTRGRSDYEGYSFPHLKFKPYQIGNSPADD